MQDLLAELLWRSDEITASADRLCKTLPGFQEAEQSYDALAGQICSIVGLDLYDQYFAQLMRFTDYERQAYYALGLGLREELMRTLGMCPSSTIPSQPSADSPFQKGP